MSGRSGGRNIGRTGPRIGLPVEPSRTEGRSDLRAGGRGGWTPDPALGRDPRRSGESVWQPTAPGGEYASRQSERLSITHLFEHMDPKPRSYRDDAYEDAPKIAHSASRRSATSLATAGALIGGAAMSILIVFVAGFLSAVLIFGEPDEGGELAIRTAPIEQGGMPRQAAGPTGSEQGMPSAAERAQTAPSRSTVVPSATAGRAPLPAPAPEIAAAEAARQSALNADRGQAGTMSPTAITPPVREDSNIAAPPTGETPTGQIPQTRNTGTVVTDTIIFPPAKPVEPPRQTLADAPAGDGTLSAPAGNYSLQFGAFRDRGNAEALVREIAPVAKGGIAEETGVSGNTLYYVRAGAFRTRADALEAVRDLRERTGIVTFVHANRSSG